MDKMGHLTGKTAIITGAGRAVLKDGSCGSIGYGIATAYAKEGANLVITGRNVKKLEDAKEELERLYGIKVLTVQADVSAGSDNEAVVKNVIDRTIETFGRIDVLINNAQASASGVPLADHSHHYRRGEGCPQGRELRLDRLRDCHGLREGGREPRYYGTQRQET